MKISKAELLITAGKMSQYPSEGKPEIAFAGRSNVGKSSLINALVNRKALARTSGQPGKTQTVNFYEINEEFRLIDLPGYGYAKVAKENKATWPAMINEYLDNRESLLEVILLVDIRHEPGEHDTHMYEWIKSCNFSGIVIANKADKVSKGNMRKYINIIKNKLKVEDESLIIPFSSTKKTNRDAILSTIEQLLDVDRHR